ncbi:MAG: prolyl oligopeptidase family serine peptidase [Luteolibacter sp.]
MFLQSGNRKILIGQIISIFLWIGSGSLSGAVIPANDVHVVNGLSPYNWVVKDGFIGSAVNGASLTLKFKDTLQLELRVASGHLADVAPARCPIIAWSVNGGALQTRQLVATEESVLLSSDVPNPVIDLYIRGMSPFEDRHTGDVPGNSVKITGFTVDEGGKSSAVELPKKIWLNVGDSITSGDGALSAGGQGRPTDDSWASSDDGRASYGELLARHYGYREARIAYGGFSWSGGMVNLPPLDGLIDQSTSTVSRLRGGLLSPSPDVVLVNLGENRPPPDTVVIASLKKLRSRVNLATKIIVMIPVSGRARAEVSGGFNAYKKSSNDNNACLVDLGSVNFESCDGQHPTVAGHQSIFRAAMPLFDPIVVRNPPAPETLPLWSGQAPVGGGKVATETAFITIHRPVKPNGAAVVICPGGGYEMLMVNPEGHGIARWLNEHGITGVVLEYRLPGGNPNIPLLDAQRAIRIVRSKARTWGCDPQRVGIMGFSAGGHLASTALTHFQGGDPIAKDPIDRFGCRPDFGILIYPVISMGSKAHGGSKRNLLGPDPDPQTVRWFSNEEQVTANTPPTFLAHAQNDATVSPEDSRLFYDALKFHQVPAIYLKLPTGGHGLNGYRGPMWDEWQDQLLKWLAEQRL